MFSVNYDNELKTGYNHNEGFNRQASDIMAEHNQSVDEDLDI